MDNLKNLIDERLWNEIKRNYLNEEFSNAVLDGIQFLGDLIREMSGEDGDGYNLIGNVFNSKNPKIKVNHLRTQTDKNIQNGIMLLLQGFYRAIRNERVHEKKIDSEQEAYEIILFINHILRIIDKSKGKFTIENTLKRVFDDNFLPRVEYVEHIVKGIPKTKKFDVAIEVYRNRKRSNRQSNLAVFWNLLKNDLKSEELENIRAEISESLRYAEEPSEITSIIFLVGSDWKNLDEDARLRAENLLIRSLPTYLTEDPRRGPTANKFTHISNALYVLHRDDLLELDQEFAKKVFSLLEKSSYELTEFIINAFGGILKEIELHHPTKKLDDIVIKKLKNGNTLIKSFVERFYSQTEAAEMIRHMPKDIDNQWDDMDDDLPF